MTRSQEVIDMDKKIKSVLIVAMVVTYIIVKVLTIMSSRAGLYKTDAGWLLIVCLILNMYCSMASTSIIVGFVATNYAIVDLLTKRDGVGHLMHLSLACVQMAYFFYVLAISPSSLTKYIVYWGFHALGIISGVMVHVVVIYKAISRKMECDKTARTTVV
ncbi:hypothetical protein E2542_SST05160 [Spatholobus suberectus]|nr:hypothetical protein E2542_SST05160 [Spatholobus suberectus]